MGPLEKPVRSRSEILEVILEPKMEPKRINNMLKNRTIFGTLFCWFCGGFWGSFQRSLWVHGGSKYMEGQNWKLFLEGIWKASVQDFGTVSCAFVATLGSGKCILAQHYSSFHTF